MLISEKMTGSFYVLFFASKEAYPIDKQLEKLPVKTAQAKVVTCAKNKSWVPRTPPPLGHLSDKEHFFFFFFFCIYTITSILMKPDSSNSPHIDVLVMIATIFDLYQQIIESITRLMQYDN